MTSGALEPLLVLGGGRTGTTLLMQLLGTSPAIAFDRAYPYETRYLTYLARWATMLGAQWDPTSEWSAARAFAAPDGVLGPLPHPDAALWNGAAMWPACLAHAWEEFARRAPAADERARYYAEKVPYWLPDTVRRALPCRVLVLVRDPRDTFLSISAFDRKRGFTGFSRRPGDDDATFAERFIALSRERFRIADEELRRPGSVVVSYEALAQRLPSEAGRLGAWLGLTLDAAAVESRVPELAHHMTSATARDSVGRWRRELAPALCARFERELGPELARFGYA